jgi:hypothetical protein
MLSISLILLNPEKKVPEVPPDNMIIKTKLYRKVY